MSEQENIRGSEGFVPALDVGELTDSVHSQLERRPASDARPSLETLMADPEYYTVSFRRHGRYERGDNVPTQRGQLTSETMLEVRENAKAWVNSLPENAAIRIINSPTFMPAEGPTGNRIEPARARATGALYGSELRNRFGEGYGYLADESLSAEGLAAREKFPTVEHNASRELERRIGDIFEMTTKEQSEHVPAFFKKLSETYGGLTPEFWKNFIQGTLPSELNDAYLKAGGEPAVKKAANALDVLSELTSATSEEDKKKVTLLISHEEVIGSVAYQIVECMRDSNLVDVATAERLEAIKFSYNEGFDINVDSSGNCVIDIKGERLEIPLADLRNYVHSKADRE